MTTYTDSIREQERAEQEALGRVVAGDKIYVYTPGSGWGAQGAYDQWHTVIVSHVTRTQIVCGEQRFRRDNGKRIGDHHGYTRVRPMIEAVLAERDEHKARMLEFQRTSAALDKLHATNRKMPLAALEAAVAALEAGIASDTEIQ